jgi:hypothetical protein
LLALLVASLDGLAYSGFVLQLPERLVVILGTLVVLQEMGEVATAFQFALQDVVVFVEQLAELV